MSNAKTVAQKRDIVQELHNDLETLKAAKRGVRCSYANVPLSRCHPLPRFVLA